MKSFIPHGVVSTPYWWTSLLLYILDTMRLIEALSDEGGDTTVIVSRDGKILEDRHKTVELTVAAKSTSTACTQPHP